VNSARVVKSAFTFSANNNSEEKGSKEKEEEEEEEEEKRWSEKLGWWSIAASSI
jgi:hypothetical protein